MLASMAWMIEYTNHPFLEKKRRKALERALADSAGDVESLLKNDENTGLVLGDSGFNVESVWLPGVGKHHLGVRYAKRADDWVATVTLSGRGTMTLEEVKSFLKDLDLNDCSLAGLGVTNEKTVGQRLTELGEGFSGSAWEIPVAHAILATAEVMEAWLSRGTIRLNDGLLDALRKIQNAARGQPATSRTSNVV